MNEFKRLDMIDRVPEELWTKVHNITGGGDQNQTIEKNARRQLVV